MAVGESGWQSILLLSYSLGYWIPVSICCLCVFLSYSASFPLGTWIVDHIAADPGLLPRAVGEVGQQALLLLRYSLNSQVWVSIWAFGSIFLIKPPPLPVTWVVEHIVADPAPLPRAEADAVHNYSYILAILLALEHQYQPKAFAHLCLIQSLSSGYLSSRPHCSWSCTTAQSGRWS